MQEFVDLEPDGRAILIYPLESSPQGALVARLDIDDDFATDNRAYLALNDGAAHANSLCRPGESVSDESIALFSSCASQHGA